MDYPFNISGIHAKCKVYSAADDSWYRCTKANLFCDFLAPQDTHEEQPSLHGWRMLCLTTPTLLTESSSEQSGSMSWTQKLLNTVQLLRPFCVQEALRASALDLCLLVSNLCLMTFDKGQSLIWILSVVGMIQASPLEVLWCLLKISLVQSMPRISVLFLLSTSMKLTGI